MIRLLALWAAVSATLILWLVIREERLVAVGKVPAGRLRRLWFRAEKRRAPRYRVNWDIRYFRPEGGEPPHRNGQTRDVSQTGAGLTVREKLPVGSWLHLEMALPDGPSSLLRIQAEVVWTKEIPGKERVFFVGIRFHNLNAELEQQLRKALGNGLSAF